MPDTKRPSAKRTATRLRSTRFDPQATQTVSEWLSVGERGDLRGDEDVEDLTLLLPDDRPFCVDERPFIAEAPDDLQFLAGITSRAAAGAQGFRDGLGVDNRFDHLAGAQPVAFHLVASLFGEPYPSPYHHP